MVRIKQAFPDGKTPLIVAIESGLERIAMLLLDYGADPTLADNRQMTALHHAVLMVQQDIAARLLSIPNVDIDAPSRCSSDGDTPLMLCAKGGEATARHIAPLLLHRGADPNKAGNATKRSPLHLAAAANNEGMVKLLLKSGANVDAGDANVSAKMSLIEHGFQ